MATAKKGSSGIIMVRGKKYLILPPGILGFSSLEVPDAKYSPDNPEFSCNVHHNDEQQGLIAAELERNVITPLWDQFCEEAKAQGKDPSKFKVPNAADYVAEHMKEPRPRADGSKSSDADYGPFMKYKLKSLLRKGDGEVITRHVLAWAADKANTLLDLPSLKIGMGSIIQPVVLPALFSNPLIKPQPSLQLVGIRVLKLEQWGGAGPSLNDVDDSSLQTLGADFEAEDLSSFVLGMNKPKDAPRRGQANQDFPADMDDEIPF